MEVQITPGTYVVAVSGGVDSVVLLDLLSRLSKMSNEAALHLIVAHVDHGIRSDSTKDRLFVQKIARDYDVPFVFCEAKLGQGTSEELARACRYAFLYRVVKEQSADAIITAHHQDDVIETAIINILRGTRRKGVTALQEHPLIRRPLLHLPKSALLRYAKDNHLHWREDSTNQDTNYLRNHIRHNILPRFDESAKEQFRSIIAKLTAINSELDDLLENQLQFHSSSGMIDRQWFNQLPHTVAREVIADWLRLQGERHFDSKGLERLVVAAKVARPGKMYSLSKEHRLLIKGEHLALATLER